MIDIKIQNAVVAKITLGRAVNKLPLQVTVVHPSTVFVCFACRVVYSMHCLQLTHFSLMSHVVAKFSGNKKANLFTKNEEISTKFF